MIQKNENVISKSKTKENEFNENYLKVNKLSVNYGNNPALKSVSFNVNKGEFVSLLGPSGCGKTTMLRVIAGFVTPTEGNIFVKGKDIINLHPSKRNIGLVFQNYALWPHMNVFENISYGLKLRGFKKNEIEQKVEKVLLMLGLSGLERRFPRELSGGEQQRVAVGRIAALDLNLYLMDEPLSNLDRQLRVNMRLELVKIHRELKNTIIYVTHDQEEALSMSDTIVVMEKGEIIQIGSPEEIYENPKSEFVANFIGIVNAFETRIIEISDKNILKLKTKKGGLIFNIKGEPGFFEVNEERKIFIRPEKVLIMKDNKTKDKDNIYPGKIVYKDYQGCSIYYHVELKNVNGLNIIIQNMGNYTSDFNTFDDVLIKIPKEHCFLVKIK